MDAIIGRYKVNLDETRLTLKHPAGISFDLTPGEAIGLADFIDLYRHTLQSSLDDADPQTEPHIKAIVLHDDNRK